MPEGWPGRPGRGPNARCGFESGAPARQSGQSPGSQSSNARRSRPLGAGALAAGGRGALYLRAMGALTEATFTECLQRGCAGCGGKKFLIETYVEGAFGVVEGEPDGSVAWAYKGETFVDGVFAIGCVACGGRLFDDPRCPRCHAPGGLARALAAADRRPVPAACPRCAEDSLRYRAFAPASVVYEGKRAGKAKARSEPGEAGFHGLGAECPTCGPLEPRGGEACPLCDAPGPLRPQPA